LIIGVAGLVLSGRPGNASPGSSPSTTAGSTEQSPRPSASADSAVDEAAIRAVLTVNERLEAIADELERELASDRPVVSRLAASLRQANVAVGAGRLSVDRLAADPATESIGTDVADVHSGIRERAGSTLSNSLVNDAAYVMGSEAVVALVRALDPLSQDLRSLLAAAPSAVP
jgi:hypothetical protein